MECPSVFTNDDRWPTSIALRPEPLLAPTLPAFQVFGPYRKADQPVSADNVGEDPEEERIACCARKTRRVR